MENRLDCITNIESELMMVVSLVLSVRQLYDRQNHLFCDSKISDFKKEELVRDEIVFGGNGIFSISNFSSLAEKQKHWLRKTLILMIFEINSLAATGVRFSSSMTNCSISAASW